MSSKHPPSRYSSGQGRFADALWRALLYCLHPRVILLSVVPVLVASCLLGALAWWGWEPGVATVRLLLDQWSLSGAALGWLDRMGAGGFRAVLAPLLLLMVVVPVVVIVSLLLVAWLMTPALVKLVAGRRFPNLQSRHVASGWTSLACALGATLLALVALILSLPLWFVPPFALVLPPLIWGWLTFRVMGFDVLADHATPQERRTLMVRDRLPLLTMGVVTGLLGAAPAMVWALGAMAVVFAPVLLVVSVWLYTLVFAFSSLWFVHFLLDALTRLRALESVDEAVAGPTTERLGAASASAFVPPAIGGSDAPLTPGPTSP